MGILHKEVSQVFKSHLEILDVQVLLISLGLRDLLGHRVYVLAVLAEHLLQRCLVVHEKPVALGVPKLVLSKRLPLILHVDVGHDPLQNLLRAVNDAKIRKLHQSQAEYQLYKFFSSEQIFWLLRVSFLRSHLHVEVVERLFKFVLNCL